MFDPFQRGKLIRDEWTTLIIWTIWECFWTCYLQKFWETVLYKKNLHTCTVLQL